MKYNFIFFLIFCWINLSGFAQSINLSALSFNQKYSMLKDSNCLILPKGVIIDNKFDSTIIKRITPYKIEAEIINKILNERILIINEDHLFPQTRVFAHFLLNKLLKADTNYYVFFEALNRDISKGIKSSISIEDGYYFQEPQMAENLRLSLKYSKGVFCYDGNSDSLQKDKYLSMGLDDVIEETYKNVFELQGYCSGMNNRDMNEFINFYEKYSRIIKENSKAKFIIIVGHGHVSEEKRYCVGNYWYPLAFILKKYLKYDPTTIDLTTFIDKCHTEKNKYYDYFTNIYKIDSTFIYLQTKDILKKEKTELQFEQTTDFCIISPKVKMKNGRENWLAFDGKKYFKIEKKYFAILQTKEIIFKAFYKHEDATITTPADIVYVDKNKENYFLLYPGEYAIFVNSQPKPLYFIQIK
ncbi:MAG: hypothetical protein HXX09_08710 [Bacteroidetes bacterium]|nr:hypothetical protein [Bacteroidota bacterium]